MRTFGRLFLRGLAAILPIGLTVYVLFWIGSTAEGLLRPPLVRLLPEGTYRPGMGVAAGLLLVFLVGIATTTYLARLLLGLFEQALEEIPVVKTLYGAFRDTVKLFHRDEDDDRKREVVLVEIGGTRLLGFVTRDAVPELTAPGAEPQLAVYLPMSYQIGGFTVLVPRAAVQSVALPAEDALRFAVTAGMSGSAAASALR